MVRTLIPDRKSFLLLAGFWLTLLPLYGLWLWRDQVTAPWDMSGHARLAFDLWRSLCHGRFGRIYTLSPYYPPLFHLLAAPLTMISSHPDVYCAANWLALFGLIWAVWLTGRRLVGPAAGLAAGALVPAYVYVSWMCRMPMIDLVLTTMVAWTLWLLVRGAGLSEGRQAHALGICMGLGLLAKWPYAFFTALPVGAYLWHFMIHAQGGWRARKNRIALGWTSFWPLLLAGPWYWRAIPTIVGKMGHQLRGEVARLEGVPAIFSATSLVYYARHLEEDYLRLPLLLLLAAGLISLCWERFRNRGIRKNAARWVPGGLTLISGYGILTLIANKDPRYVMPLIPVLAVVSTHWLDRLGRRARVAAVSLILILSFTMVAWNLFRFAPPSLADMKVETLAEWIVTHKAAGEKKLKTLVIPNDWTLNATALDYALHRRDRHCGARLVGERLQGKMLVGYQYVLIADPPDRPSCIEPYGASNTEFMKRLADWQVCASFTRGDGLVLKLLQRIPRTTR